MHGVCKGSGLAKTAMAKIMAKLNLTRKQVYFEKVEPSLFTICMG